MRGGRFETKKIRRSSRKQMVFRKQNRANMLEHRSGDLMIRGYFRRPEYKPRSGARTGGVLGMLGSMVGGAGGDR